MDNRIVAVAALLVLAAAVPAVGVAQSDDACSFPVERTDATGEQVRVSAAPQRVVTLSPSAAQTMQEIGAWDKLVGATKHASNLEGFDDLERNISGAGQTINNEEVVGLEPDLVLAPNTVQNDTVRTLGRANLTVYRFREATSIADIQDKTRLIGRLTGECDGAAETVAWMDERLAVIDEATAGVERPKAMYVFYGWTAGNGTFIGDLIERAGADNAARTADIEGYKEINREILLQQNPDWLVLNSDWSDVPRGPGYNGTTAVQENQVVVLDVDHLNRPAPRVIYPLQQMTEAFHPEAYAAANRSGSQTTSPPTTTAAPSQTPTEGADGPGLGLLAALVAIWTVALLGRRS